MIKYIRYKGHVTLYTEDNWRNIKSIKNESPEGKEETNKDIVTEVKLRYLLGDDRAKIIIKEFQNIRKDFNLHEKDGYGHEFEIFAISVLHNIDYDVAYNNYIVHGNKDGKIDAIYWRESPVIVYQIKLSDLYDLNDLDIMKNNFMKFTKTGNVYDVDASDLLKFCNSHKEYLFNVGAIYKTISTNNKKNNIDSKEIFDAYFENAIISKENNIKLVLSVPMDNGVATLKGKENVYAYFVDAKEFIKNILDCESIRKKENVYKLFFDNVRGFLGINKSMEDTIENDSENFVKYNNGITITGKIASLPGVDGCFEITSPVINNGQQTVLNLLEKYPNIDGVNLLIILKNESDIKIKSKISQFTNSQRLIKPIDLLSLDDNIRFLQGQLFHLAVSNKEDNFFLEINSTGTKNYQKLVKTIYFKENIISLADFCKLYFSVDDLKLGNWKSNISTMIEEILSKNVIYDVEKSLMICKIISKYKRYLNSIANKNEKNIVKTADLAFMFIMYKYKVDEYTAREVIDGVNQKYFYNIPESNRKSKLIDLYKSNSIVEQIENIINELNIVEHK